MEEEYDSREYQQSLSYLAYAKDLCENYNFDRSKYRLCIKEKGFAAITRSDFAKLKEDLQFLDNALKTVLSEYRTYFRERFVDGLSIRKYAEAHGLNRGSVDYVPLSQEGGLAHAPVFHPPAPAQDTGSCGMR